VQDICSNDMQKLCTLCCGQIDPTQAVKVTGFNHREHRVHRVFKSILRVPLRLLWLYFLLMSFMSVAVLCIQPTITKLCTLCKNCAKNKNKLEV
jgi:hypothetical protein